MGKRADYVDVTPTNAADTMNALSIEQLKRRSDSLIENISALRFCVARIELMRDLLEDYRVIIAAHGHKALVAKIDKAVENVA
jgi:hypothetical protein